MPRGRKILILCEKDGLLSIKKTSNTILLDLSQSLHLQAENKT